MTCASELRLPSSTVLQCLVATIAGLAVAAIANPARAQADAAASAPAASHVHAKPKSAAKKHRKARPAVRDDDAPDSFVYGRRDETQSRSLSNPPNG